MANRQALRDLQARLAERLQAARGDTRQSASWLAVQIGSTNYLLPLEQSGEIFTWPGMLRVPYAKSWFLGVSNLRGSLVGVVDASAYLGQPIERTEQSLSEVSLLSLNTTLQVNAAIIVDRLLGLRGERDLQIADGQPPEKGAGVFGIRCVDAAGEVWQVLNLQQLVQQPEFLNIRV